MRFNKNNFYLILIFLLALVIKIITAFYTPLDTDEMIYSLIPLNIISAERLGNVFQSHLYFYFADIGYQIAGGLSPFTARLPSIIFGSFLVFIIYLVAFNLFKNRKVALTSSFLFALSGYVIRYNIETDMPAFFFSLLSILFFIKGLRGDYRNFYLSSLFLAFSVLIKNIVLIFIPVYLLILIFYYFKKKTPHLTLNKAIKELFFNKKIILRSLICCSIFVLIISPVLIYNYLIYKYNGFTDIYFASFGFGKDLYSSIQNKPWNLLKLTASASNFIVNFFKKDGIIFIFGLFGAFFSFRKNKYFTSLLLLSLVTLFVFVGGITGVGSHALWVPIVLSIFSGYSLVLISKKVSSFFNIKFFLKGILVIALILSIFSIKEVVELSNHSSTLQLWDVVHEQIPSNAIVVMDPRIYRGSYAWVFNDRDYLEGTQFFTFLEYIESSSEEKQNIPFYYIECRPGSYCGWKPEDFNNIESYSKQLSEFLLPKMKKIAEIKSEHNYWIYQGTILAPKFVHESIIKPEFWFYPVGWWKNSQIIDDYNPVGIDILFNKFGFVIFYLTVFCSLLTIFFVIYLVITEK